MSGDVSDQLLDLGLVIAESHLNLLKAELKVLDLVKAFCGELIKVGKLLGQLTANRFLRNSADPLAEL